MAPLLSKRQCNDAFAGDCDSNFWWSDTGLAIRYAVVVIFFLLILGFIIFSYVHAQRRIKRGLQPLGYHRWLVSRRYHPRYQHSQPSAYYMGPQYGAAPPPNGQQQWQNPPPAYNGWDAPPMYQPPQGGTKVMANQHLAESQQPNEFGVGSSQQHGQQQESGMQYPPPAHPPPGHERA